MVKIRVLHTTFSFLLVSALHIKFLFCLSWRWSIISTPRSRSQYINEQEWLEVHTISLSTSIWIILYTIFVVHDHREWRNLGYYSIDMINVKSQTYRISISYWLLKRILSAPFVFQIQSIILSISSLILYIQKHFFFKFKDECLELKGLSLKLKEKVWISNIILSILIYILRISKFFLWKSKNYLLKNISNLI